MPRGATALLGMGELKVSHTYQMSSFSGGATALLGMGELKVSHAYQMSSFSGGATALLGMGELKGNQRLEKEARVSAQQPF